MRVPVPRDTVEPFWDFRVVEQCLPEATRCGVDDFLDCFRAFLGTRSPAWVFPSGRAALTSALGRCVSRDRPIVLVSAFNCPVVADAVRRSGGRVECFDFDHPSGRIDWERVAALLTHRHAALIVPHLFGVPSDFRSALSVGRRLGVRLIEDCAHTLGGTIAGCTAGTLGDASVFSFNYDKPICLAGGGVLVAHCPDLAPRSVFAGSPRVPRELAELQMFLAWRRFRRRQIGQRSLFSRVMLRAGTLLGNRTRRNMPPCSGLGSLRCALGIWQLKRYPDILASRGRWAGLLALWNPDRTWHCDAAVNPGWLRQKLIPRRPYRADAIAGALQRSGLRVGRFNWPHLIRGSGSMPPTPNAEVASRSSLDVPIHQEMTEDELRLIQREVDRW